MDLPTVTPKKFIVIPRDALDVLMNRFGTHAEATQAATDACAESGQTMFVVEMQTVAARADRPVRVTKL